MKSPFQDIGEGAYAPFFDDTVSITTKSGESGTFDVSVFQDGIADTLSDDMMDTEREDLTFVFSIKDWPFVKNLKRGDTIQRFATEKTYVISEAKRDNLLGWVAIAREK